MIISKKPRKSPAEKIAVKEIDFRDSLWPDAADVIWNRQKAKGFATIPKTFPIVFKIMDEMAGVPVSTTYLALFCQAWDNGFARIKNVPDLAYSAGYVSQRGERTFRDRIKKLVELGFIRAKPNANEPFGYLLFPNPHEVIISKMSKGDKTIREASYNSLVARAYDVGAKDVMALIKQSAP